MNDAAVLIGIELHVRREALGGGGMHEVLGGATQTLEQMAVVRVDGRAAP